MILKAVLFDLDGTLLDTAADFTTVLNTLLQQHGRPTVDYHRVRQTVSDGARAVVSMGFEQDMESPGFDSLLQSFLDAYAQHLAVGTTLFPGMAEQLTEIENRGMQWGIVTNKPARFTEPLLEALELQQRCATAICPDHVSNRKPHPEPIYLACQQLGVHPRNAIYLGDHRRDIDAGRNAGMATVACRYGYIHDGDNIENWGADYIIDRADDLTALMNRLATPETSTHP